jgi:hypothetical protein
LHLKWGNFCGLTAFPLFCPPTIRLTPITVHVYIASVDGYHAPKRPLFGRGTPAFALGDWANTRLAVRRVMVSESCQVAFTSRQWEAYQFVLKFHRQRHRAPTAVELGQGLKITLVESARLIGVLTAKGVLERRVYHVLAVVPPTYQGPEMAEF